MRGIVIKKAGKDGEGEIRADSGQVYTFRKEDVHPSSKKAKLGRSVQFFVKKNPERWDGVVELCFAECAADFQAGDVFVMN